MPASHICTIKAVSSAQLDFPASQRAAVWCRAQLKGFLPSKKCPQGTAFKDMLIGASITTALLCCLFCLRFDYDISSVLLFSRNISDMTCERHSSFRWHTTFYIAQTFHIVQPFHWYSPFTWRKPFMWHRVRVSRCLLSKKCKARQHH